MVGRMTCVSLLFVWACCQAEWILEDNNDYLAVLKVNYTDSAFEGGYLYKFATNKESDSLPLRMDFSPTWDFGSVSFTFTLSNLEVFKGGVIWMGGGRIEIPDTFYAPNQFPRAPTKAPKPDSFRRFHHEPLDSTYTVDYAWDVIDSLTLVHSLTTRRNYVGLYLYPPSVGAFNPFEAKVIVFIYAFKNSGSGIRNPCQIAVRSSDYRLTGRTTGMIVGKDRIRFDPFGRKIDKDVRPSSTNIKIERSIL